MILVALSEAADRSELLLVEGGFCRFHLRRDGVVVIREILVLPGCRGKGIGAGLVAEVTRRHPGRTLRAVCPSAYDANKFWAALGFHLAGGTEKLNTWELT